jgi:hypothetical protein
LAVPDANHPADADGGIRPVPEGYNAVTPWTISRDTAALLDFVKEAFGAEEIARVPNEDGTIGHAEFRIGDSIVMAFDAKEGVAGHAGLFPPVRRGRRCRLLAGARGRGRVGDRK